MNCQSSFQDDDKNKKKNVSSDRITEVETEAANKDHEEMECSPNTSNEQNESDQDDLSQENDNDDILSIFDDQIDLFPEDDDFLKR